MQISKLSYTTPGFAGNINSASNSKREVVQLPPYEERNYNNTHFITTDYGNDGQATRITMRRRDLNDEVIEYLPDGGKKIIMGEMLDNVPLRGEVKFLFEPTSVKYFDKENETNKLLLRDGAGNFDYRKKRAQPENSQHSE